MMIGLDRATENAVWEIGPEKFARKGHERCVNPGSLSSTGVAYIYMATTGGFADLAMQLCSCVVARVRKHGLKPIRRMTTLDDRGANGYGSRTSEKENEVTERMEQVLKALRELKVLDRAPSTPNEIAMQIGFREGGTRHGHGWGKGAWSGRMAPANRVNFAILALEKRGLVRWVARRDDLTGRAVELVEARRG